MYRRIDSQVEIDVSYTSTLSVPQFLHLVFTVTGPLTGT